MLRKIGMVAVLSALMVALSAAVALAVVATENFNFAPSGAHYAKGESAPVCTENETTNTVSCTGTKLQGVGNTNATVTLTVNASADILCRNPGKNRKVVEPHTSTVTDTSTQNPVSTRNGRITINPISETISQSDVEHDFTCPNPNWTEDVQDVTITSWTYRVVFAGEDGAVFSASG